MGQDRGLLPPRSLRLDPLGGRLRLQHLVNPLERPHRPTDMLGKVLRGHGRGENKGAIHGKSVDRTVRFGRQARSSIARPSAPSR